MAILQTIKVDASLATAEIKQLFEVLYKEPVKVAIASLIAMGKQIDVDALTAIKDKGHNLPEDLKALKDVADFFEYFQNSFLPVVDEAIKTVK
jgi:hypothetical protein